MDPHPSQSRPAGARRRGAWALTRVVAATGAYVARGQLDRPSRKIDPAYGPAGAQRCARRVLRALDARVEVFGALPGETALYVANHRSYLDVIALLSVLPARFLAKKELAGWPLFGPAATLSDTLYVDRADRADRGRVRAQIGAALASGRSVVVFPEGTTRAAGLGEFRRGAFEVAHAAGVPVVPIAIEYPDATCAWVGDDTLLAHFLRTVGAGPTRVAVGLGAPTRAASPAALATTCRAAIEAALPALRAHLTGASAPPPSPVPSPFPSPANEAAA